jgi:hypothetical protein
VTIRTSSAASSISHPSHRSHPRKPPSRAPRRPHDLVGGREPVDLVDDGGEERDVPLPAPALRDVGEQDRHEPVGAVHRERVDVEGAAHRGGVVLEPDGLTRAGDPAVHLEPVGVVVRHEVADRAAHGV